jgi:hypothetical protein
MAKLKVNKRKIGHVPENVFAGYLACFDLWPVGPWRAICELAGRYGAYGTDVADMVSVYTGVILRGARPVDLAVLQLTKFTSVLNKQREWFTPKTARSYEAIE